MLRYRLLQAVAVATREGPQGGSQSSGALGRQYIVKRGPVELPTVPHQFVSVYIFFFVIMIIVHIVYIIFHYFIKLNVKFQVK